MSKTLGRRCRPTNVIQMFCVCWNSTLLSSTTLPAIKIQSKKKIHLLKVVSLSSSGWKLLSFVINLGLNICKSWCLNTLFSPCNSDLLGRGWLEDFLKEFNLPEKNNLTSYLTNLTSCCETQILGLAQLRPVSYSGVSRKKFILFMQTEKKLS